jgi:proteasome lid subunit RPN8/RPN11
MGGKDGVVTRIWRTTNIDHSPVKYTIDPQQMAGAFSEADKSGLDILGFYHSHTQTEAYPSPTDTRLAPPSDLFDYQYVIVSLREPANPVLRCFRIVDRKVHETTLEVAG